MRDISTPVKTLLAQENVQFFYLVKIGPFKDLANVDQTIKHSLTPGGITIGSDVYTGTDDISNTLLHIDPPRMSSVVDKESYKLTYADPDFLWRPVFEKGFYSVPIIISLGFYNTTNGTLGGAAPGYPLTSPADIVTVYSGYIDAPSYSTDLNGETTLLFECSSPMGDLAMTRTLVTSRDNLNQIDPTDTSFDEIYVGSRGLTLLWGKQT